MAEQDQDGQERDQEQERVNCDTADNGEDQQDEGKCEKHFHLRVLVLLIYSRWPHGSTPGGNRADVRMRTWVGRGPTGPVFRSSITSHARRYGLSGTPAPMLSESGWTDDLFPPAQSLRVYNQARAAGGYVALQFGDLGHSRGSNKVNTNQPFNDQGAAFFDAKLRGTGTAPASGTVTAYTQTCPATAPGGGPYSAASWAALHPGTQTFGSAAPQSVDSGGGNPMIASAFDPIAGTTDACKTVTPETDPGTAVYTMPSPGFTLMGLPKITATINTVGSFGELTARLWDVSSDGTQQRLITRGVYRLTDNQTGQVTSSCTGTVTSSPWVTRSSWSCWVATRRTTAPATARLRSRSQT